MTSTWPIIVLKHRHTNGYPRNQPQYRMGKYAIKPLSALQNNFVFIVSHEPHETNAKPAGVADMPTSTTNLHSSINQNGIGPTTSQINKQCTWCSCTHLTIYKIHPPLSPASCLAHNILVTGKPTLNFEHSLPLLRHGVLCCCTRLDNLNHCASDGQFLIGEQRRAIRDVVLPDKRQTSSQQPFTAKDRAKTALNLLLLDNTCRPFLTHFEQLTCSQATGGCIVMILQCKLGRIPLPYNSMQYIQHDWGDSFSE